MSRIFIIFSLFFSLVITSAMVEAKPAKAPAAPPAGKYMTKKEYKKRLKLAKRRSKNRRVANVDRIDEEAALSGSLKDLRNRVIGGPLYIDNKRQAKLHPGVTSPEGLSRLITLVNSDSFYSKLDQDAKLVAAQLSLLAPLRGLIHRARPLIENHRFTHSTILTLVRLASSGINIYLPNEEWDAGFKYISEPYRGIKSDIEDDEDFYQFLYTEIRPSVLRFNTRIASLNFSRSIYFDNKILYKTAGFTSNRDRFLLVTEAERQAILGASHLAISGLNGSIAYSWTGFFDTLDDTAKIYGFDAAARIGRVRGATAENRVSKIKDHDDLGVLRSGGQAWMAAAFKEMKEGIRLMKLAWTTVKRKEGTIDPSKFSPILDPRAFAPFNRIIGNSFDNLDQLIEGEEVSSLLVEGEVVEVDVKRFFETQSPKKLQDFLAIDFDDSKFITKRNGFKYRNYLAGSPTTWNKEFYALYFPGVKTDKDIKLRARILNQTWGGWMIGVPFMAAMF